MCPVNIRDCCFLSIPKDGVRLVWEATQYCPYSCEYCFTWSSPKRKKFEANIQLLLPRIQKLIERINVKEVLLTGGEPLTITNEIAPLLSYFNSQHIPFSISTNLYDATLFENVCRFQPSSVNLSVDPPLAVEARSAFKAKYEKIEEKLRLLEEAGQRVKLTAVVSKSSLKGIQQLLDFLGKAIKNHSCIDKIAFNREYPIGFAAEAEPQKKSQLLDAYATISRWSEGESVPISLINWSEFHAPLQACPAAKHIVSVQQNGDVTPCSLLYNITRSFRAGNVITDPVDIIAHRLEIFSRDLEKYYQRTEDNTPSCAQCQFRADCGGGCLAMLPITSNHIPQRTCEIAPKRVKDHERVLVSDFHRKYHEVYSPELKEFVKPHGELAKNVELRLRKYVKVKLVPSDLAHTMEHVDHVVALTKLISRAEGAAMRITVPAAYFHDLAPREAAMHHMHTYKSAVLASEYLHHTGLFTQEEIFHIQYCIITSSYGSYLLGYEPLSLEAKVVRDADWLDAIGARGIARVFAFEQAHGAKEMGFLNHVPVELPIPIDMNITGPDGSPIYHFQTKLLKIRDLLKTETAKKLAKERHEFMIQFLRQYEKEINVGVDKQQHIPFELTPPTSEKDRDNH